MVLQNTPNPSTNGFTIEFPEIEGEYIISNTNGNLIQQNSVRTKKRHIFNFQKEYILRNGSIKTEYKLKK